MKFYIAGKITGDPGYREKFQIVSERLERGHQPVLNPASLPEGMTPADYIRICFSMIDCADAVVFLPDWNQSEGAKLEYQYCKYIEKETVLLDEAALEALKGENHEADPV